MIYGNSPKKTLLNSPIPNPTILTSPTSRSYSCSAAQPSSNQADAFTLSYPTICAVIGYAWTLGLVQAILELFILVVSLAAFLSLKLRLFANHGCIF
jgi:hypothetical protein